MGALMFSVVIPLYNQKEQLKITLHMFDIQQEAKELFEVIVVNDASSDISQEELKNLSEGYTFPICILEIPHSGSAAARNAGAAVAKGEFLVFCDADRFPDRNYLRSFRKLIRLDFDMDISVFQGRVMECFSIQIDINDFQKMVRFSRENKYYQKIIKLYAGETRSSSKLLWLSFLVGNTCVRKTAFENAGTFDEQFSEWGFEHFDLGLRLIQGGAIFFNAFEAVNYHIPHSKHRSEYKRLFEKSASIMNSKYPQYNECFSNIARFLYGEVSLQELEQSFYGNISDELLNSSPVYYKF